MSEHDSILDLDEDGVIQLLSNLGFPFYDAQIKGKRVCCYSFPGWADWTWTQSMG